MRTVRRVGTHELTVQRSRFICTLGPAGTADEAATLIETVRKQHWSATHNCSAYRVGPHGEQQRSSDDGEPAGTAGVPMLQMLAGRDVTDTVAVVTRYFGGVKLGAGGLVRAYGRCVGEALDAIGTLELVPHTEITVTADHAGAGRLEHELRAAGHLIVDSTYAAQVTFRLLVPTARVEAFGSWVSRLTAGAADVDRGPDHLRAVPNAGT